MTAFVALCSVTLKSQHQLSFIKYHYHTLASYCCVFYFSLSKFSPIKLLKFMRLYGQNPSTFPRVQGLLKQRSRTCQFSVGHLTAIQCNWSELAQHGSFSSERWQLVLKRSKPFSHTFSSTYFIMFMLTLHFFQHVHLLVWTEVRMSRSWSSKLFFFFHTQEFHVPPDVFVSVIA